MAPPVVLPLRAVLRRSAPVRRRTTPASTRIRGSLMSRRVLVPSLVAGAARGGVAAGELAAASISTGPALGNGSAHHVAPSGGSVGPLAPTAGVRDDSGARVPEVVAAGDARAARMSGRGGARRSSAPP